MIACDSWVIFGDIAWMIFGCHCTFCRNSMFGKHHENWHKLHVFGVNWTDIFHDTIDLSTNGREQYRSTNSRHVAWIDWWMLMNERMCVLRVISSHERTSVRFRVFTWSFSSTHSCRCLFSHAWYFGSIKSHISTFYLKIIPNVSTWKLFQIICVYHLTYRLKRSTYDEHL